MAGAVLYLVSDAASFTTGTYIISDGVVLAQGPPEEILGNAEVRSVYLGENFRL